MTAKLYIQKRGPSGGTDIDLTAFTGRKGTPFFDGQESLIQMGMRCSEGQASQGEFKLMDPDAELPQADFSYNAPSHALVTWTEDASGNERWLSRGRVAGAEGGRGGVLVDNEVEFDIQVDDGNIDLSGQAFTEPWVRPSETDVARLIALQAYTLNGASSTADFFRETCDITISASHLAPNTGTVTMPAKKYPAGTQPRAVIDDCASTAGKIYGVVIHHTGGSHLCLLYVADEDHSTYSSAAKISDHIDEWDPYDTSTPVWEPNWQAGKASLYESQTLLSGLVSTYGIDTSVYASYDSNIEAYDYWVDAYTDGVSTTASQAQTRAAGVLEGYRLTHVTHRVSVICQANQTHLIAAGMSIQIKAAAALGGQYVDTYQTRRIAELSWEPRHDGSYWAHMYLDRPPLKVGPRTGSSVPAPVPSEPGGGPTSDYLWTFGTNEYDDTTGLYPIGGGAANSQWHPGYVHTHVIQPEIGNDSASSKPVIGAGTFHFRGLIRRGSTTYNPGGVRFRVRSQDGGVQNSETFSSFVTATSDTEVTFDVVFPAGTDTFTWAIPYNDAYCAEAELSHGTATASFAGTPPPPASTDGSGTIGTSLTYSPIDHQHPWQEAENTPIQDEGGYFTGGNVEEALQEIGANIGGAAVPESPFHHHDLVHGYDLTKLGIVIERGDSGSWKEALVESPNVFWDPRTGKYVMVFVGYSGTPASPTEGALGYATADDPAGPWTEYGSNPFFSKSGSGDDSHGCSGPLVWYEDGTYHLYYIGLTASGYEQGTKSICHATSSDFSSWTRHGAVIETLAGGWREDAVWHPNIVRRGSLYYLFFNATGTVTERIGYATSTDLDTWTVDDTNSPVLSEGTGGQWDDGHIGDPYVYRIGETWYMAYYGYDGTNSRDGIAYTSDADFPLGWTKFSGNPVLDLGTTFDEDAAHKPSIWLNATRYFHFYTAVSDSFLKREIALAVQDAPAQVPNEADIRDSGIWEVIVSGTAPPVAVTNEDEDDWVYGWVSG